MRLDFDYALDILQSVADSEKAVLDPGELGPSRSSSEMEKYGYHCWLLHQEGLIEIWDARAFRRATAYYPKTLTWAGHDFLQRYLPKGLRERIKEEVQSRGWEWSFATLRAFGQELVRQIFSSNPPPP